MKAGKADVGTVRSDTLERMEAEGKIKISDFRIINPVRFLLVRSPALTAG
ncbi:hypothetical protein DSCO28_19310 [Desulfosarcina ovata subsp. sediminis]|uniref:Uncharacterized protein n=1 Tax=Desulfosarcina ovata subsp. sediminis TaxID=885957 RepID=A0A5K7ZM02_9BACT|nr:hypothetical protein DSCO28_19310 [Desulfosarcina ovata subsp. sediminis]